LIEIGRSPISTTINVGGKGLNFLTDLFANNLPPKQQRVGRHDRIHNDRQWLCQWTRVVALCRQVVVVVAVAAAVDDDTLAWKIQDSSDLERYAGKDVDHNQGQQCLHLDLDPRLHCPPLPLIESSDILLMNGMKARIEMLKG
jgi:hypothetical protein